MGFPWIPRPRPLKGCASTVSGILPVLTLGGAYAAACLRLFLPKGKDPAHLAEIAIRHAEAAGRCIITRISPDQVERVRKSAEKKGIAADYRDTGGILVLGNGPAPGKKGGIVAIITAGTSDIRVAEEARIIAEEMGCEVRTTYDVGAAGIHRLFPALKSVLAASVFIVCAGREGTLPAVVAGLVDKPVIGVPVSVGYGYMGKGRAALASMLQSCSVIAVVNIDAGFTARCLRCPDRKYGSTSMKRGFYIGRFQPYHNGHQSVLEHIAGKVDEIIIGIGSAQLSHHVDNPFTAGERVLMITRALASLKCPFYVIPIEDIQRNAIWVAHVRSMAPPFELCYSSNPLVIQLFRESGIKVQSPAMYERDTLSRNRNPAADASR